MFSAENHACFLTMRSPFPPHGKKPSRQTTQIATLFRLADARSTSPAEPTHASRALENKGGERNAEGKRQRARHVRPIPIRLLHTASGNAPCVCKVSAATSVSASATDHVRTMLCSS